MAVHPLFIHFPLALLLVGSVATIWQLLKQPATEVDTQAAGWEGFISGTLGLGYLGLLMSVASGLFDMLSSPKGQVRDGWIVFAAMHIIGAVLSVIIFGVVLYRRLFALSPETPADPAPSALATPATSEQITTQVLIPTVTTRPDYLTLALLIIGLLLLVVVGWLGGTLVYEYRVGVN